MPYEDACMALDIAPTVDAVPLSVIEDIKAEIEIEIQDCQIPQGHDAWWNGRKCGLEDALEIIDKHISGGEE